MPVSILTLPYDSGHYTQRMGAGPQHLLRGGLENLLQRQHQIEQETIHVPHDFPTEISTSFALYRQLAERVQYAQASNRFPLVLAGNCGAALGVVAGLRQPAIGVIWLDSHGDFHTPETTEGGFLDGMGLATLTGRCWQQLVASIPGYLPVPATQVVHIGGRSFEPLEHVAMQQSGLCMLSPAQVTDKPAALERAMATLARHVTHCYVHVDLDVLDATRVGRANTYATAGGLLVEQVVALLQVVRRHLPICAATLASYDPQVDVDGRILTAAMFIAQHLVPTSDRQATS